MQIGITHEGGHASDAYHDNFENYPPLAMVNREGKTGRISLIVMDEISEIRHFVMLARDDEADCAQAIFDLAIKNDVHRDSPCSKCPKFQVNRASVSPHRLTMETVSHPADEMVVGRIKLNDIGIECEVPCEDSFIESVARKALTINSSDPTMFSAIMSKGGMKGLSNFVHHILEMAKDEFREVPLWSDDKDYVVIPAPAYVRHFNPHEPLMNAYKRVIGELESGRLVDSYLSTIGSGHKNGASSLSGKPLTSSASVW